MTAASHQPWQQQRPQSHEIISEGFFANNLIASPDFRDTASSNESREPSVRTCHVDVTTIKHKAKRQPWQAVWPAAREPASQANIFGFKKGEVMVFDGNAGNFFARDAWTIEQEVDNSSKDADTAHIAFHDQ